MSTQKSNAAHYRTVKKRLAKYPRGALRSAAETYLRLPGQTLVQMLADINEELGANHKSNRLYEWLAGTRAVPDDVREWARREALYHVLQAHIPAMRPLWVDIDDEQIKNIVDDLS